MDGYSDYILWRSGPKRIPPRPDDPSSFDAFDARHWYDHEYGAWTIPRLEPPQPPSGGAAGRNVIAVLPTGPYMDQFSRSMQIQAEKARIRLKVFRTAWSFETETRSLNKAIEEHPDLIVLVPLDVERATECLEAVHSKGIPVIASNMMPDPPSYRYLLAWTGPDAWSESRLLARRFAELMDYDGGYCIVQHVEHTSTYYSRAYGVASELRKVAPRMQLLDMASSDLDTRKSRELVTGWLQRFGKRLRGIVSPDDELVLPGVVEAIASVGRNEIVLVSNGCTEVGLRYLIAKRVLALTYKPPALDGALPIQIAADWFNGLAIPPAAYLPTHIVTPEEAADLLNANQAPPSIDVKRLSEAISEGRNREVEKAIDRIYHSMLSSKIVKFEFLSGVLIRLIGAMAEVLREYGIDEKRYIGDYEDIFKMVTRQSSVETAFAWIRTVAAGISSAVQEQKELLPVGKRLVNYVNAHYDEELSLKVLSADYGMSPTHLGRVFHAETNERFTEYVNRLRIEQAKELLCHTTLTGSDIAPRVGFSSSNYFYQAFRRYTGQTPSEFKEAEAPRSSLA